MNMKKIIFLIVKLNFMMISAEMKRNGRVNISPKRVINGDSRLSGFHPLL